jgi:cell wall-associated NlpC family hydrolase
MLRACLLLFVAASHAAIACAQAPDRPIDPKLIEKAARRIEPDLHGNPARLEQYLDAFRRELTDDRRLVLCDVTAEAVGDAASESGGVRLAGAVELAETRAALAAFFTALGFANVDNQIAVLPDPALGELRFGFVKSPHALSLEEPNPRATVGTDCLLGEALMLLREVNGFYQVHAGDGYLSYIPTSAVHRVKEANFARYQEGPRAQLRSDHKTPEGATLPAGSRLKWIRSTADGIIVELPSGQQSSLPNDITQVRDQPKSLVDGVVKNARQLLGTHYLWGGKTSAGVDCSGLVQTSFASVGVSVPRDANEQFHVGRLTGTRWCTDTMRRGDTIYFVGPEGRVRHTGIYLGENQYIHAGSPVVMINSFKPGDENYDEGRHKAFAFARRLWD